MYLTKKERKLQLQEKIIGKLREENDCLREQLEKYNPQIMEEKFQLADKSYKEYKKLILELEELKLEYQCLIRDIKTNNHKFLKESKRFINKKERLG